MRAINKKTKVLITGGSRGIGRGIAHVLHEAGYEVIVIGQSKESKFLNPEIRYIKADLSTPKGISQICKLIDEETPPVLLNC